MKARFVALAVAATLGLGSVSAFAQDYHRGGDRAWQHQRADQGRRDWGNNHRYEAPRYYGPSRGYRNDNGDVFGALVLGAITGAVLGQAANNYNYNAAPPAYYAPPPATYYNPGYGYGYGYYGN
jgi:hypothetical protein